VKSAGMGGDGTKIPSPCTPRLSMDLAGPRNQLLGEDPDNGGRGHFKGGISWSIMQYRDTGQ